MAKFTQKDKVDVIEAYTTMLVPMNELARKYSCTRQAIWKVLKKHEVDTSKKLIQVSCTTCGAILLRPKCRIRKQKHHFCDYDCYYAFLDAGNGNPYLQNKHGQRIARRVVEQFFSLEEGHIVHHEDGNTLNNTPQNLKVFACQGDHVRYHRGFEIEPLWDGSSVVGGRVLGK